MEFYSNELTKRELSLIRFLRDQGNWQSELIKLGFNFAFINSMVSKNLLKKDQKKKVLNSKLSSFKNDFPQLKKPNLTLEQKKYTRKCKGVTMEMSFCYGEKQALVKQKFI